MAVVSANVVTASGGDNVGYTTTFETIWVVIVDDEQDGPVTVLDAVGLPAIGDTFAYGNDVNQYAIVSSRTASLKEAQNSRWVWTVKVTYSKGEGSGNQLGGEISGEVAVDAPAKWSGNMIATDRPLKAYAERYSSESTSSISSNLTFAKNTAGESFSPPIMKPEYQAQFTVQKNLPELDLTTWRILTGRVNAGVIWGFPVKNVMLTNVSWSVEFDSQFQAFYPVTFTFLLAPGSVVDGVHKIEALNAGFNQLVGGELTPIIIKGGKRPAEPWPLKWDGSMYSEAQVQAQAELWLEFHYDTADLSALGLPTEFGAGW